MKHPKQEQLEELSRKLARKLKADMPADVGFVVLVANHGGAATAERFTAYLSTVQRQDAVALLREFLGKLEPN